MIIERTLSQGVYNSYTTQRSKGHHQVVPQKKQESSIGLLVRGAKLQQTKPSKAASTSHRETNVSNPQPSPLLSVLHPSEQVQEHNIKDTNFLRLILVPGSISPLHLYSLYAPDTPTPLQPYTTYIIFSDRPENFRKRGGRTGSSVPFPFSFLVESDGRGKGRESREE